MSPVSSFSLLLLLAVFVVSCSAAPDDDRVLILPGLPYQPKFRHFSGYLQAGGDRHLHYWLVESSQTDASKSPLVLWFNGGPGCSSMEGFLREHGPFIVNDRVTLDNNPYAWNRIANVLYIEAPAGVGFSYSDSGDTKTNDTQVANDNYLAIVDFMKKFPEYKGRELHISGESYAGVYVPTLAARVLQDKSLKLKGVLIGNGINSWRLNSLSLIYFGYYHGLIGYDLWQNLTAKCCKDCPKPRCDFYENQNQTGCAQLLKAAETAVSDGLDIYNLYKPCHGGVSQPLLLPPKPDFWIRQLVARRQTSRVTSRFLAKKYLFQSVKSDKLLFDGVTPPCTNDTALTTYMNMAIVRYALHVKDDMPEFSICANLDYTMQYQDMTSVYQTLLKAGVRMTLYNGDVDMACNFLQTEWFLQNLNMTAMASRKPWYFQHPTEGKQIGGYVQQWKQGVKFLTVRGSGHMVPEDKPVQAYELFKNYLSGKDY